MALRIVHHPGFKATLRPGHRFPMGKYQAVAEEIVRIGLCKHDEFYRPSPAPASWLELAHDRRYVDQVFSGNVDKVITREIGFEVNETVASRARLSASGTLLAGRLALEHGISATTAGGSHHARRTQGAGFCVFNDVGVAASVLLADQEVERILVFDCDVHQGDGTADIFSDNPRVFTVSIHSENNYPVRKIASDMDIGLPDGVRDDAYIEIVDHALGAAMDEMTPDLVFFNAGVDTHADDALGRLAMTDHGLMERNRRVFGYFRDRNIPVVGVLGGGYSSDIDALAKRHATLHLAASEFSN